MNRIIECGYTAAPITDRASTFGFSRWSKLSEKHKLKPVFGLELAVTESISAKKPIVDYWTFIAKDDILPLHKLFELATTQFRYEPLITYEQAQSCNLFKIVGYRSKLELVKPADDLFIGLAPSCSRGYINQAIKAGFKFVACSDNKFTNEDDQKLYEVICGKGASAQTYDQFIQTDEQWSESLERKVDPALITEGFQARKFILNNSNAKLKKGSFPIPEKPETLQAMCEQGAVKLKIDLTDAIYKARLEKELRLIDEKKFEDYFYIVADLCKHMRQIMLVGGARGSSCGSLVCYLLEITTIDPIPYGLIFERFIDIHREDLPDIDIDFSDQQRHKVFEYLQNKYGAEHVAKLGTVATYKSDGALSEVGKALGIPKWEIDTFADSILKRSGGDARALDSIGDNFKTLAAGQELLKKYPEMIIAEKMEGCPTHYSQHASGIILTKEPVNHYVAIDQSTGATQCDKKDAEDLNLLKIDVLGLTQLSVFEDALDLAKLPRLTLESIPMDDPEAFKVIRDSKFSGIFQFNGMALQSIVKQFYLNSLDDIVCVTALARPGPLASGGAHEWVRRKNKVNPVVYPHPMFEPDLKDTLGIVLYQEQVMNIGRNIGDLSWGDVTQLRKSMSKSLGKEYFNQWGDKWKTGAIAKGGDPKLMDKVWDDLCAYGSWSFNKSHAVAYGIISYQCAWLKAHYPFEFAAATLTHESDPDKQLKLLREMVAEGYNYVPVDKDLSTDKWTFGYKDGKRFLVGPITNVKGIGPKTVQAILESRARNQPLPPKAQKLLANPITPIDSLYPVKDAFKRLLPDPTERNIWTTPTPIVDVQIKDHDYEVLVFCKLSKINPRDENEAVNIARRGGKRMEGNLTASLNLQLTDDSDTIFGKITRYDFPRIGKDVIDRGRVGKCIYAIKGKVKGNTTGSSFRMILIKTIRYIGDMSDKEIQVEKIQKDNAKNENQITK